MIKKDRGDRTPIRNISEMPDIADIFEVATFFGVTEYEARRWCREGKFPNARLSRKNGYTIPKHNVEALMREMYGSPDAEG